MIAGLLIQIARRIRRGHIDGRPRITHPEPVIATVAMRKIIVNVTATFDIGYGCQGIKARSPRLAREFIGPELFEGFRRMDPFIALATSGEKRKKQRETKTEMMAEWASSVHGKSCQQGLPKINFIARI